MNPVPPREFHALAAFFSTTKGVPVFQALSGDLSNPPTELSTKAGETLARYLKRFQASTAAHFQGLPPS